MCGSTQAQTDDEQEQNDFYKEMTEQYQTTFGENQAITGALTSAFTPIFNAGPSQEGYSAGEKEALNTQATEGAAKGFGQAQTATSEALAARGGGNTFLPSGSDAQLLAQNNNAAAASVASAKNTILQGDYAQGYQNWQTAAAGLGQASGDLGNTSGLAGATTGAGSAAANTANQIASQQNSIWQGVVGAAGALGGAATGAAIKKWG